ncbi:protein OS-9-like, partial [Polypterus senegalus]|uniref:protein OS-9-like n=1 Tax=Polypterus senegalus TaxID=55291 RepID=UPI0019656CAD
EAEGLKGEFDRKQASKTLNTPTDKVEGTSDEQHEEDVNRASASQAPRQPDDAVEQQQEEEEEGQIKIRITKFKPGSSSALKDVKVQEMSDADPRIQQIRDVVKGQLEKAGLKAEGKIEVKILSRGGADDDDVHWLTEEDTKSFRELLINLLVRGFP